MKQYLALKASAGSGKTFALTVRYISLLLLGAKPKEILTLTFTNKAANEMSERIYQTLLNLGNDEIYLSEISKNSGFSKEKILQKKDFLVNDFINATLSIYTIDKFVNKILREFCGYIGISDDFEIKEDDNEALSAKFLQSLDEKSFDKLIDFALFENKKYSSLFEIFKNLFEKNEKVEIVDIDESLIYAQKEEVLIKALRLKEFVLNSELASKSSLKAVDYESVEELLSKGKTWLAKTSPSEYRDFKKLNNELFEQYFLELKKELEIYFKIKSNFNLSRVFRLYELFKEYKKSYNKSKNYLHFTDISNLTYEMLSSNIYDNDFLYFRLDSNFNHILIDEFQDTSLIQYKILYPLISEILSGSSEEFKTFFYVGDTKQSIYRFRGGKRELFDYVLKTNKSVEVEVLNTNYRSKENVVNFVNEAFIRLPSYEYHNQLSVKKGGYVEVFEDEALLSDEKYENIAKKISELLKAGINSNDIAILTYTNEDVLNIYSFLKKMFPSLKISTEMTSKLINQQNVKALVNAVKYLYFNEDIYKENLNALRGKKLNTSLDFNIDIKTQSLQTILYTLANSLNIMDENVIRLIEISNSYKNLSDFVYEIDKQEASIENSEQVGLQILTIFKSKGLEFHTVLLVDRIKQKVSDKSSLLFEYDDVNLKRVYYKTPTLDNYDEDYKEAIEKEKRLSFEDELNILYVAITRAKNNMLIFKKSEKSVFDLLDLKPYINGELVLSENKSKNYEKFEKVIYKALDLGVQEKPIAKKEFEEENSLHARYFGIATHYCLEMMNSFDEKSLTYSMNLVKNRYSNILDTNDFLDIENRVRTLILNSDFINLTSDGLYDKEQALIYKNELKIIDLLVQKDDKFYIFDYKTTKEEHLEHTYQVSHYKKAIKDIVKSDEVYSYVVYLKDKDCVKIKEV